MYTALPKTEQEASIRDDPSMAEELQGRYRIAPSGPSTPWLHLALCLMLGLVAGATITAWTDHSTSQAGEYGGPPQFAPQVPLTRVIFEEKPELMSVPSNASAEAWDALMPPGHGFVNVSHPQDFALQPGIPTPAGIERYSVAMFHQLHCLGQLRQAYWKLMDAMSNDTTNAERESEHRLQLKAEHTQHCFAYLAQSIWCSGDLTLEWASIEKDGRRKQVDGWGIPHQCKDPARIWQWMDENHGPLKSASVHIGD